MLLISLVLALHLGGWLLRRMYKLYCLHNVRAEFSFSKRYAAEGETVHFVTSLVNRQWLPVPWLVLRTQVDKNLQFADAESVGAGDDSYRNDLYSVMFRQRVTRRQPFICLKRGVYTLKSAEIVGRDFFFEHSHVRIHEPLPNSARLTVLPRPLAPEDIAPVFRYILNQVETRRFLYVDPFTFKGIREYQPFDPLRAVNSKASAKMQTLMVNVWQHTWSRRVLLILDLRRHFLHLHGDDTDERAIRIVAALADFCAASQTQVQLVTNGVDVATGEVLRPHRHIPEALAHIDLSQNPDDAVDLFAAAAYDTEVWLVSAYQGSDLIAAAERCVSDGTPFCWIMPRLDGVAPPKGEKVAMERYVLCV